MTALRDSRPPRLARLLAQRLVDPEEREFLLGDMEEEYRELRGRRGRVAAWAWYWLQAVGSARASSSSTPEPPPGSTRPSRWETLSFELRNALRSLCRTPAVTVLAVVTLALGVGANTAMVGLVDALLFRLPEHVEDPRRIVSVSRTAPNFVRYRELRDRARTLDVAAYTRRELGFGSGPDASRIAVECVTHTYFPLLGVQPALGRIFTLEEDVEGGRPLVMLAHGLWRRQLGSDPGVVGRTGRARVAGQLLLENLLLAALCGMVAGIVAVGMRLLLAGFFPLRPADHLLDGRLLGAMVALTFLAGLLTGALPALQGSRTDPAKVLRGGFSLGSDGSKLRNSLLVGQVALSFVLLVCAGLFVRSVDNLRDDPGYDWDRIVVVTLDLQRAGYGQEEIWSIFDRLRDRVRRLPEVESASIGPRILGSGGGAIVTALRASAEADTEMAMRNVVSPDYFTTLGTRIVEGRPFGTADTGRPVIVLDQELAATLWQDEERVGKCVSVGFDRDGPCLEVIGISESRRHADLRGSPPEFFVPVAQARSADTPSVPTTLLVRTRTPPEEGASRVAAAVHGAEPGLPFAAVRPLADLVSNETRTWRLGAGMFGLFGGLAVLLGAVGIYGLLAMSVRQQTPAIGVRMALGATAGNVVRRVFGRGIGLLALGLGLGGAAAWATTRYIESLLYEVAPSDVPTFVGALLLVALTTLAGCVVPAARAARVDPAVALRSE